MRVCAWVMGVLKNEILQWNHDLMSWEGGEKHG